MKVWTLHISHRHGDDVTVYATEELATAELNDYVTQWWDREHPDEEMPEGRDERIRRYFELFEHDVESASLEWTTVKGARDAD